jgi:poly(A) polymerase
VAEPTPTVGGEAGEDGPTAAIPAAIVPLFELFAGAGQPLYLVGGAVRDWLLGTPLDAHEDLDFTTPLPPDGIARLLKGAGYHTFDVGRAFGTIGTVLRHDAAGPPVDVQITTYRTEEVYRRDSRHPTVRFGESLAKDLERRDLSINAIAMDAQGRVVDPCGGRRDLEARLLRVIGEPHDIFDDDPLRILRVARFVARLGFRVDAATERAAFDMAHDVLTVSRERWRDELARLLVAPCAADGLRFMERTRVLGVVLPEVAALVGFHHTCEAHHKDLWVHTLGVIEQAEARLAVRWAALLHDVGKPWTRTVHAPDEAGGRPVVRFLGHEAMGAMLAEDVMRRLRVDANTARRVTYLVEHHARGPAYDPSWSDAAVRRFVVEAGEHVDDLLDLAAADLTTGDAEKRAAALARLADLRRRVAAERAGQEARPLALPRGLGNALMARYALPPGPEIGRVRAALEEALVAGDVAAGESVEYYVGEAERLGLVGARATGGG